jgi:tRNA (guanine-N(7)-)-methyltransferase subunit TRM82
LILLVSGSRFSIFNLKDGQFVQFQGEESNLHSDLIRSAAWSSDGTHLATVGDDKVVKLWLVQEGRTYHYQGETQKNPKKLTSVVFASDAEGEHIIYSDKFGEVFSSPVSRPNEQPKVLLGHVSILTEVLLSPGGDLLLSADRDEKIRVSQYPKAYNIEAYCLGHTQFVSRICIPTSQPSVLFSGSADGTVRVWRYVVGELLHTEDLKRGDAEKRIVTLPVAFSDEKQTLVVLVEGVNSAFLFKLVDGKELKEVQQLALPAAPWDATFDKEDNLWVSTSAGVHVFSSGGADDTYAPVDEGHALSAALQLVNERREQQGQAVLGKNVEQALTYGMMRKRTAEDKAQAKKRKLEEANANVGGAKEKRKQRRNKGKKTAEKKKQDDDTSSTSAMDEVKAKAAPVPEKED